MPGFYAVNRQRVDETGTVVAMVVKWSEPVHEVIDGTAKALAWVIAAAIGAYALASFGGPDGEAIALLSFALLGLAVVIGVCGYYLSWASYEVSLGRDGRITMPRGFIGNRVLGPKVMGDHRRLSSVQSQEADELTQVRGQPKRYDVYLYYRSGATCRLAEGLDRLQAHQLAVVLKQALQQIGDAASQPAATRANAWVEMVVE